MVKYLSALRDSSDGLGLASEAASIQVQPVSPLHLLSPKYFQTIYFDKANMNLISTQESPEFLVCIIYPFFPCVPEANEGGTGPYN